MRRTLSRIFTEYGPIAVAVYLTIFVSVLGACWAAISMGWQPTGIGANVGAFTAAYLATKVTQPVRIAATVAVTPLVARAVSRLPGRTPPAPG
ncbi:MAG TPA: hypothetical protein VMM18_17600 [Gemmatimonadaceae bacterium]|nr:hypothetical protein [Gemmatimonadaceae bacterium]